VICSELITDVTQQFKKQEAKPPSALRFRLGRCPRRSLYKFELFNLFVRSGQTVADFLLRLFIAKVLIIERGAIKPRLSFSAVSDGCVESQTA